MTVSEPTESIRPFPEAEYLAREATVRAVMAARNVDVLYVTSPANLVYLTGYEAVWYPWRLPLGCAVVRDPEALIFFDWTRHEAYARLHARHDELVLFDYGDAVDVVTRALGSRGLTTGTVAVEWCSQTPAAPVTSAMAGALEALGAEIVSGDWLVDGVRLLKSKAELQRVRRAAAVADEAFAALAHELHPGLTEIQVSAMVGRLLADAGGDQPAQPALVSSGSTAWCDTHAFPTQRPLVSGDLVAIDACGVIDRYHANLCRTFSLGPPDDRAVALLEVAAGSVPELQRLARVGEGPEAATAAAERWVRDRVPDDQIWWVGGYSLGISFSPSWVGHTYLANDGLEPVTWQPGYVSNYETILFDRDAGFEAAAIDTVLMTATGLEVLSALPRGVIEVGA